MQVDCNFLGIGVNGGDGTDNAALLPVGMILLLLLGDIVLGHDDHGSNRDGLRVFRQWAAGNQPVTHCDIRQFDLGRLFLVLLTERHAEVGSVVLKGYGVVNAVVGLYLELFSGDIDGCDFAADQFGSCRRGLSRQG